MNTTLRKKTLLPLAAALLLAAPSAQPDFIGDSDGNSVTATADRELNYAPPANLVNGSGMTDNPVLKTSENNSAWWNTQYLVEWGGGYPTTGWVKFTFTKNSSLKEMVIWNAADSEGSWSMGHGMRAVTITCSTGADTSGTGTSLYTGDLNPCVWGTWPYPYQNNIAFAEVDNAKSVRIIYTSNWGHSHVGLSEVRFVGMVVSSGVALSNPLDATVFTGSTGSVGVTVPNIADSGSLTHTLGAAAGQWLGECDGDPELRLVDRLVLPRRNEHGDCPTRRRPGP